MDCLVTLLEQQIRIERPLLLCVVQYDWCSWIPNAPSTMRQPPPNKKGLADIKLILESLPDRGRSSWHLGAVWALSQYQDNEVLKRVREP